MTSFPNTPPKKLFQKQISIYFCRSTSEKDCTCPQGHGEKKEGDGAVAIKGVVSKAALFGWPKWLTWAEHKADASFSSVSFLPFQPLFGAAFAPQQQQPFSNIGKKGQLMRS